MGVETNIDRWKKKGEKVENKRKKRKKRKKNSYVCFLRSGKSWHQFCMLILCSIGCCSGAFAGTACSVCLTLPALGTMVCLCAELEWCRGRGRVGPTLLPQILGWDPGIRSKLGVGGNGEAGGHYTSLGARLWVKTNGAKKKGVGGGMLAPSGLRAQSLPVHCPYRPPPGLECWLAISCC